MCYLFLVFLFRKYKVKFVTNIVRYTIGILFKHLHCKIYDLISHFVLE